MTEQNNKFPKREIEESVKEALFNEVFSFSNDYAVLEKKLIGKSAFAPWDSKAIKKAYFTPSQKIFKKINPLPGCFTAVLLKELKFKGKERDKILAIVINSLQSCHAIKFYCQMNEKVQLDYKGLFLMMSSLTSYAIGNNLLLTVSGGLKDEYEFLRAFSDEINKVCLSLGYHFSDFMNISKIRKKDYFAYVLNSSLAANMRLAAKLACLYKSDDRLKAISELIDALIISKDLANEIKLLKKTKKIKKSARKRFFMSFLPGSFGQALSGKERNFLIKKINILLRLNERNLKTLLKKKSLSFLKSFAVYFRDCEFDVYD